MRHMSIVTAAASVKLQPHPSSLLFPLHPPHYLLQTVLPGKQRWKMQFSIQLEMSEFVCEVRVVLWWVLIAGLGGENADVVRKRELQKWREESGGL